MVFKFQNKNSHFFTQNSHFFTQNSHLFKDYFLIIYKYGKLSMPSLSLFNDT